MTFRLATGATYALPQEDDWYYALMVTHRDGFEGLDRFLDYLATTGRTLADFETQHGHQYEHNDPIYGYPLRPKRDAFLRHAASRPLAGPRPGK